MRAFMRAAFVAGLITAPALGAQSVDPGCPPGTSTGGIPDQQRAIQDACQKAIDLFKYMTPQLSAALAGGNAVLGSGATIGRFGHISLGVRASLVEGSAPQVGDVTPVVTGAQQSTYRTKRQILGFPSADLAIGIVPSRGFGGYLFPGVDLLVSAQYLRNINTGAFSVELEGKSMKYAYGARVGLLSEGAFRFGPSVSFTYLDRELPTVNLVAASGADQYRISALQLKSTSWRVVVGKNLGPFAFAAGTGKDSYESSAAMSATVVARTGPPPTPTVNAGPIPLGLDMDRSNSFVNVSFGPGPIRLSGEYGRVSGGSVPTYNRFDTPADEERTLFSFGLVLQF